MEQYDASVVVCICTLQKGAHIYTISVGCLFSSFISLVFGDTTFFDEQYRVPHAF